MTPSETRAPYPGDADPVWTMLAELKLAIERLTAMVAELTAQGERQDR